MKYLSLIVVIVSSVFHTFAQDCNTINPPSTAIDSLINIIENREQNIDAVKKSNLADSLNVLVENYALLSNLWQKEYETVRVLTCKYKNIEPLLSESDSIFLGTLPDVKYVPTSLIEHYKLITQIIDVQKRIDELEQVISKKTEACIQINADPMTVIPGLISLDLESVYLQILQIKDSGLPTFSSSQKEYFEKNIIDRYNNFEKYFTNE